jgi:hypothetical protein
MNENEMKLGDFQKPKGWHPNHKEDLVVMGFLISVLCLLMAIGIVGLLRLVNP